MSLRTVIQHNRDGSEMTQANRSTSLFAIAAELRTLGYPLRDARELKAKHVHRLITHWKAERIADATIKNRLSHLRWWAMKAGKPGLIERENAELGIGDKTSFKGPRAAVTTREKMATLPERMQLALKLQMAFGLREEESLKFTPEKADNGTYLALQASWCKGGRARAIPLLKQWQRDLIDEAHHLCDGGSVVPAEFNYITYRRKLERATLKAGITNMHKHRHAYACRRYRVLAGELAPAEGGRTHDQMTAAERIRLDAVRLEVSHELGHGRIDVTDTYLGGRWPTKAGKGA